MAKPETSVDAEAEFDSIQSHGITHLVTLLESEEAALLGLSSEESLCASRNIEFIHYPIADFTLPNSATDFLALAARLHSIAVDGGHVLAHCRGGIGRSGMMTAAVLLQHGESAEQAIKRISTARGTAIPDTDEQREFILSLESRL